MRNGLDIAQHDAFMREYVEMMYQYYEPQIVDSSAFERTFGMGATAIDDGLRATIEWYREQEERV
jgi:nucleoside-diphosphate-sugar epimerase